MDGTKRLQKQSTRLRQKMCGKDFVSCLPVAYFVVWLLNDIGMRVLHQLSNELSLPR